MNGAIGRAVVAVLVMTAASVGCKGGCQKETPATEAGAPAEATSDDPSETPPAAAPADTRPAPYKTPEEAFQALFDALKSGDRKALVNTLVSIEECEALTGDVSRCARIARRRKEFVQTMRGFRVPPEARDVRIVLDKAKVIEKSEQGIKRSLRIQRGAIAYEAGGVVARIRQVAAMEVEGGWRIVPAPEPPRQPPAPGQPAATPPPAAPPAAPPAPPAVPPAP